MTHFLQPVGDRKRNRRKKVQREPLTQVYCHTAFLFMSSIPTFPVLDLCFHGNIRLSPILYGLQSVIGHTFRIWTNSIIRLMCTCVFLFCAVCKMGLETHMRSYFFHTCFNYLELVLFLNFQKIIFHYFL